MPLATLSSFVGSGRMPRSLATFSVVCALIDAHHMRAAQATERLGNVCFGGSSFAPGASTPRCAAADVAVAVSCFLVDRDACPVGALLREHKSDAVRIVAGSVQPRPVEGIATSRCVAPAAPVLCRFLATDPALWFTGDPLAGR